MRNVEELRRVRDRRPFEPFHVHLADGRDLRITHPDSISWGPPEAPRIVVAIAETGLEIIDATLITSIRIPIPAPSGAGQDK